jgi:UDP-N-acetylmuramoyl-tripeptide--D-alanyl-D-alanine ligase
MKPLTLQQVSQRVGGELWGPPAGTVTGVTTDSRKVAPGDLFVALRGERFDGHRYLNDAFAGGAVAALGERSRLDDRPPDRPVVAVNDSRAALGRLAAACRRDFELPVVAVAGSNGKTTVKELLAAVLRERAETLASPASYNNDVGVPLTLLALRPRHRAAVVEAGTNHPGELAALLEWIRPDHGVLTSIGAEHLEFFGDLAGVAREESALAAALPAGGGLFVNGDAPALELACAPTAATVTRVGWSAGCAWRITAAVIDLAGTTFTLRAPRAEFSGEYFLPLLGRHQVVNAALAVAAAAVLGVTPDEARRGLAAVRPAPMRLEPVTLAGRVVLNDAYNANADSVIAALETLADVAGGRRTVAVLGPMAELGARAAGEHARVGRAAGGCGIDRLVAVGPETAPLSEAARRAGVPAVDECPDAAAAAALLARTLTPADLTLVKASRAACFERLVADLRAAWAAAPPTANPGTPTCCTT